YTPSTPVADTGAVYVFDESSGDWSQTFKLHANDKAEDDEFGCSVSLDGDRLLIGARYDDTKTGAAFVFTFNSATPAWDETEKLTASDAEAIDEFGIAVRLDGDRILVGA